MIEDCVLPTLNRNSLQDASSHASEPLRTQVEAEGFRFFPLSVRCRFGQRTFAGTQGNGLDAPTPAIRGTETERQGSTDFVEKVLEQNS